MMNIIFQLMKTIGKSTSVPESTANSGSSPSEPVGAPCPSTKHLFRWAQEIPKSMTIEKALLSGLWARPEGCWCPFIISHISSCFTVRFFFCGRRPLPFGGSHLRLPSGPAGIRTTTGSLSALARPTPYQLSHRVAYHVSPSVSPFFSPLSLRHGFVVVCFEVTICELLCLDGFRHVISGILAGGIPGFRAFFFRPTPSWLSPGRYTRSTAAKRWIVNYHARPSKHR